MDSYPSNIQRVKPTIPIIHNEAGGSSRLYHISNSVSFVLSEYLTMVVGTRSGLHQTLEYLEPVTRDVSALRHVQAGQHPH